MGGACSTYRGSEKCIHSFSDKIHRERICWRFRLRCEGNSTINLERDRVRLWT